MMMPCRHFILKKDPLIYLQSDHHLEIIYLVE